MIYYTRLVRLKKNNAATAPSGESQGHVTYPRTYRLPFKNRAVLLIMGVSILASGFFMASLWLPRSDPYLGINAILGLASGGYLVLFAIRSKLVLYQGAIAQTEALRSRHLGLAEIAGRSVNKDDYSREVIEIWPKERGRGKIFIRKIFATDPVLEAWIRALPDFDADPAHAQELMAPNDTAVESPTKRGAGLKRRLRRIPYPRSAHYRVSGLFPVTWAIIAICTVVFLSQGTESPALIQRFGAIPSQILTGIWPWSAGSPAVLFTFLSSMFMHADVMHLALNMLFFHYFSIAVEARMGSWRFAAFYLLCGLFATLTQVLLTPYSPIPMIGASGAVSGVLGAHVLLLPWDRVIMRGGRAPAWAFIVFWFFNQGLIAIQSGTNIAWAAHIGGVLAGFFLTPLFRREGVPLFASLPADEPGMDGKTRPPWMDNRPSWLPEVDLSKSWSGILALMLLTIAAAATWSIHARVTSPELRAAALDARAKSDSIIAILEAAEAGVPEAQIRLALAYENGKQVRRNRTEALRWLGKAAAQGVPLAYEYLGDLYASGRESKTDNKLLACHWYALARAAGRAGATTKLGEIESSLDPAQVAAVQAFVSDWQSAAAGNAEAQYRIGDRYAREEIVDRDYVVAADWFLKAADQGHIQAQRELAIMYEFGLGVRQDSENAYQWYSLAAAAGDDASRVALTRLARSMTSAEIARAKALAIAWRRSAGARIPPAL